MRRKLILACTVGVLAMASSVLLLFRPKPPQSPIVVQYRGDFKGHPSFWVSNCTEYPVVVGLSRVDVPIGSAWSNCLRLVPANELDFPKRLRQAPGLLVAHEEETGEITLFLPLPSAGRWRATFVTLRGETRLESAATRVGTTLRRWGLLSRRLPDRVNYSQAVRIPSPGGSKLEVFKTFGGAVTADVLQAPATPVAISTAGQAAPEALAKAREALRQRLRDLDETGSTQPAATPTK